MSVCRGRTGRHVCVWCTCVCGESKKPGEPVCAWCAWDVQHPEFDRRVRALRVDDREAA